MILNRDKNTGRIISEPFIKRLHYQLAKVKVDGDGCWIWQGAFTGRGKYAQIRDENNKQVRVSRVMLERDGRPRTSNNHVACHTCDKTACINPAHLFWGTISENAIDAKRKGRAAVMTAEHRKKLSDIAKARMVDPIQKARQMAILRDHPKDEKYSDALKAGRIASKLGLTGKHHYE